MQKQTSDEGFGNSFSTSWALQALSGNDSFKDNISKAELYLANNQESDGGLGLSSDILTNRIWSTSYAVPAILHKSWTNIMQDFNKQNIVEKKVISASKPKSSNSKIVQSKKKNTISSNSLTANAINASPENISVAKKGQLLTKLKSPFVWLLNHIK